MDAYYNVTEVETACINLAAHPDHKAQLVVLPHLSAEGRTSRALHLSSDGTSKPVFMIIGGQHGGEWGSSEIALNVAADLLGALRGEADLRYGAVGYSSERIVALFDQIDIVIFPLVNPDGRFHSQLVSGDWRKNRNPAQAVAGEPGSIGVDLNRNYDFLFNRAKGFHPNALISTSDQPGHVAYQGPAPFSEAETQNVRWLVDRFPKLRWFVDLHSGGQGVIYPWGDDQMQPGDPLQNFANAAFDQKRGVKNDGYAEYMPAADLALHAALAGAFIASATPVNGRPYGHVPGFAFLASCGTSHDWVYSRRFGPGAPAAPTWAFAVEWCSATMRPDFPLMEQIVAEVSAGLIAMAMAATGVPP